MAIDKTKTIDAIGIDRISGNVILSIFDEMDWTNSNEHLYKIQEKLNSYLSYVESGEICKSYSKAQGKKCEIYIVFKHSPSQHEIEFLSKFDKVIENAGVAFGWQVAK
jgi:hypothetical protein